MKYTFALALVATLFLSACGNKGPLVMPQKPVPVETDAAPPPAPAATPEAGTAPPVETATPASDAAPTPAPK